MQFVVFQIITLNCEKSKGHNPYSQKNHVTSAIPDNNYVFSTIPRPTTVQAMARDTCVT